MKLELLDVCAPEHRRHVRSGPRDVHFLVPVNGSISNGEIFHQIQIAIAIGDYSHKFGFNREAAQHAAIQFFREASPHAEFDPGLNPPSEHDTILADFRLSW